MRPKVLSLFLIDDRNACKHCTTEGAVQRIENRMAEPTPTTPSDRSIKRAASRRPQTFYGGAIDDISPKVSREKQDQSGEIINMFAERLV